MWKRIFILLFVFMILVGCGTQNNISATPTLIPASTSTQQIIKPTATNFPTKTPTLTLVPTLSPEDPWEAFAKFIEEDNECKLPCWLGITLGETKFEQAISILSQYGLVYISNFSTDTATFRLIFPNFEEAIHDTFAKINSTSDGEISKISIYAGVDPKGIYENITYSDLSYQKLWQRYLIAGLFKNYGQPDKIFFDTTLIAADEATPYPFVLWIVYPTQGFLVRYQGQNLEIGDHVRVCPMQSKIEITIWDPKNSNYEEFLKNDSALAKPLALGPQPIEEVTEFDINSFYEKFKNSEINTCFDTPASIWPPN